MKNFVIINLFCFHFLHLRQQQQYKQIPRNMRTTAAATGMAMINTLPETEGKREQKIN